MKLENQEVWDLVLTKLKELHIIPNVVYRQCCVQSELLELSHDKAIIKVNSHTNLALFHYLQSSIENLLHSILNCRITTTFIIE